jgi:antitoxin YefM
VIRASPSFLGLVLCWVNAVGFAHVVQLPVQMLDPHILMDAICYTHARSHLAKVMEQVCNDHTPVIITRKNQPSVVMCSLEDYQSLAETAYLLRSPQNARRLLDAIAEVESGGGTERELRE